MFDRKSRIIEKPIKDEDILARFKEKFDSLNLGRRVECGIYSTPLQRQIKGVVKNRKLCYTCEADFLGLDEKEDGCNTYTITKCYLAEENGTFSALMFKAECDKAGNLFLDERTVVVFNDEKISLKPDTNIFNVYEMRFELRNHPEISDFMDSFVMTDFNVRDCYRNYEAEKLNRLNMLSVKEEKGR